MNTINVDHRTQDGKSPTSPHMLRNPLDFIAEDHLRLRTICAEIDAQAGDGTPDADMLATVKEYLRVELPMLLADEDEMLMPLVLKRAEPEDELPKLVNRLGDEHAEIAQLLDRVLAGLEAQDPGAPLPAGLATSITRLTQATRRHLILENAVLLPLARARLTRKDLVSLRNAMLARRGLDALFAD